jgi:putative transposase
MKKSDDGKAIRALKPANAKTMLATLAPEPWAAATDTKRRIADARMAILACATKWVNDGASVNVCAETLFEQMATHITSAQAMAIQVIDTRGRVPSIPTLKRWLAAYKREGKAGLLPSHTGRQRVDYGWEARAVELYNIGSKPDPSDVAFHLIREGFGEVTAERVRTYIKTLPATLGKNSPSRVGKKLHKLTKQNYVARHMDDIKVGDIYAADGHTVDCYVAHPETGGLFRPELTVFLDLKSRYPVGWWISESESTTTTLFALSNALTTHDHVPAFIYVDVGSGYKAKLMTDEVTGFYAKFDIEPIFALPGNPHGKGWIERFFKTIRNKHDKFFDGGNAYCGDDMAQEVNRRLSTDVKNGRRTLRSLTDYVESLKLFFAQYVETPMPKALVGQAPAEVFATLQPVSLGVPMDAVARPSVMRTVSRMSITLDKRRYFCDALALFDGASVRVEYDMHDDEHVWVSDASGRHICVATITERKGVVSKSRLEDQRAKRLQGQLKRLDKHADEARDRATPAIDMDAVADKLDMGRGVELLEPASERNRRLTERLQTKNNEPIIDLDIY